jgi:hypothetical protein
VLAHAPFKKSKGNSRGIGGMYWFPLFERAYSCGHNVHSSDLTMMWSACWWQGTHNLAQCSKVSSRCAPTKCKLGLLTSLQLYVQECHCMLFLTKENDFSGEDQSITTEEIQGAVA